MQFKPYPEYKDSGVEWLGEVPAHWDAIPIFRMSSELGAVFTDGDWIESKDISDNGIYYLTTGNVGIGEFKDHLVNYISEETYHSLKCKEVFPDDILISRLNLPVGRSCIVPKLNIRFITSVDNIIFRPNKNINRLFLNYSLNNILFHNYTKNFAKGATMQRIARTVIGKLKLCLPPLDEQNQITSFLDQETSKIDLLIAKQEKLIELLEEQRKSIISHAVTKGLSPDAPMKDSGVEWLGEVPAHWTVTAPKRLGYFKGGAGFPHEYQGKDVGEYPFYKVNALAKDHKYLTAANDRISIEDAKKLGAKAFDVGSLFFAKVGAALLLKRIRMNREVCCVDNNMMGFSASEYHNNDFLFYVFQQIKFDYLFNGGAVPSVNEEQVSNFQLAIPNRKEQNEIVDYLNQETTKIDTAIDKQKQLIEKLKEYRSSIISHAVTGKIDVRDLAA